MYIFLYVSRKVKVDNMLHIGNVQTSSCNSGSNNNRSLPALKSVNNEMYNIVYLI